MKKILECSCSYIVACTVKYLTQVFGKANLRKHYGFTLEAHVSIHLFVCLSVFLFTDNNLLNTNRFSPNLVCSLMLWRSGLRILMCKFCQFLTVICRRHICILFLQDNLHKYQWIFTKLGICIDIVKIWSLVANGQYCQFLKDLSAHHKIVIGYHHSHFYLLD